MDPAAYQAGLSGGTGGAAGAAQGSGSVADAGAALFTSLGCATCHRGESGTLGPALGGIVGTKVRLQSGATVDVDDAYLRESILNPQAKLVAGFPPVMPTFKGQVSEEDLLQLITYIKTLRASPGAGDAHRES
jgi:cytochrome c oxidase subunit 2